MKNESFVGRVWRRNVLTLVGLLALAACSESSTEPPQPQIWEGAVTGVGEFEALTGSAYLEALPTSFDVHIAVANAPEAGEDGFPWILREGTCEAPGDALGALDDYPGIAPDEDGEWSGTVDLILNGTEPMVLEIRRSAQEPEVVMACGEVEPELD